MRGTVIADISWAWWLNLRSICAQKRISLRAWGHNLKWRQELMHHGHTHRGKRWVFKCAPAAVTTLQTFQHPVLALYPDGSGSIDCHARPCRLWAECLSEGICSIAGSLWTVQSVSWCCLIAAWGPVAKLFVSYCWSLGGYPIVGLGASKHKSVVSNSKAGRERRSWGSSAGGVRKIYWKFQCDRKSYSSGAKKLFVTAALRVLMVHELRSRISPESWCASWLWYFRLYFYA